jgi:hypothetical protein
LEHESSIGEVDLALGADLCRLQRTNVCRLRLVGARRMRL